MGIRHLQTYVQRSVPGGYVDVSIKDECEEFIKQKNEKPVIVIDLMGLISIVQKDSCEILCGGRHNTYKLFYEKFLSNLSHYAELVFFVDGPVVNQKFETWTKRQNARYENSLEIIDLVNNHMPLKDIVIQVSVPTNSTHFSLVKQVAKKYGKVITTITAECDTEIARYASLNPNVLAVLADDSDFLIYPGNWKYFSINSLDSDTLMTKEYSRIALRNNLELSDNELVILATLNGNDVIHFEEVENFHKSLVGWRNSSNLRFPALSKYIKENLTSNRFYLIENIATQVFRNRSQRIVDKIKESLETFNIYFEIKEPTDPLLKLCYEKHYDFTYSTLMKMIKNFTHLYNDLRIKMLPSIQEIIMLQFCKQIGIVLKHEKQKIKYEIAAKISHQDIYRKHYVDPIYPSQKIPPLIELLQREEFPKHDSQRFKLLKWTISDDKKFQNFDLQQIPTDLLLDMLTLIFMLSNKLIEPKEADIILLTLKHVNTNTVPIQLQMPEYLNPRAFHISFLYLKMFSVTARSLEVTGLKNLKKTLNFDGVLFHNIYNKSMTQTFNIDFLISDLVQYCPYK